MSCKFCEKDRAGLSKISIYSERKEHCLFLNQEDELSCFTIDDYDSGRYFKIRFCPNCGGDINLIANATIDASQIDTSSVVFKQRKRPKIVCLCGSTKFTEAYQKANLQETLLGNIVLSVGCNTKSDSDLIAMGDLTDEVKTRLDELHKRKIDLADEIFVLNVGGYIGTSTSSEIEYAQNLGKQIRFLEKKDK